MIKHYLINTNKSATMFILQIFLQLNKVSIGALFDSRGSDGRFLLFFLSVSYYFVYGVFFACCIVLYCM